MLIPISQIRCVILLGAILSCFSTHALATVYYVRPDGGSYDQCSGMSDASCKASSGSTDCAWSHPFWALAPGEPPTWRIQGGDVLMIASGSYMMGYGAPNSDWCSRDWPYECHLPPLPSGPDADHPTRILGADGDQECSDPPILWGTERATHLIDLQGTDHAEIRCMEMTDHSNCIEFHADPQIQCQRDAYPYGNWASAGIHAADSADVILKDLDIHGFASYGLLAGGLTDWTLADVRLAGNGWGGWNGDLADSPDSNDGVLRLTRCLVEWNGCGETYPEQMPHSCWAQTAGGYGDGIGAAATGGHWIVEESVFRYNTSDGMDLLYVRAPGSQIDIKRSQAYANAGDQFKTSGPTHMENCLAVSECGFFDGQAFTYQVDNCRAGGSAIAFTARQHSQISLVHSTIAGQGDVLVLAECGDSSCDDSDVTIVNNIFLEYPEFPDQSDLSAYLWYEPAVFGRRQIDYNLVYAAENSLNVGNVPLAAHDINANPKIADDHLRTFDARLQSDSPAIDAGLGFGDLNGLLPDNDMFGGHRPISAGTDMGCHEYSDTGEPFADIRINGANGPLTVSEDASVTVSLSLDCGNYANINADWWVLELSPTGMLNYFDFNRWAMGEGLVPSYQGPLFSFGQVPLLNLSSLAIGDYLYLFGIDRNMNAIPDLDTLSWDIVTVTVAPMVEADLVTYTLGDVIYRVKAAQGAVPENMTQKLNALSPVAGRRQR